MRYQVDGATFDEGDVQDMPGATGALIVLAQAGRDAAGKPLMFKASVAPLAKKHIQAFLEEVKRSC